jgi:hypothetical protein
MSTVKVYQFPEMNPELNNMFPLNPRDRLVQRTLSYRGVPYTINVMLPKEHPSIKLMSRIRAKGF